jgi:nicotinamide-nucleotide amidase
MSETEDVGRSVAAAAHGRGHMVVAAESLTAGSVATALAAAGEASEWFYGSVVVYQTAAKGDLLGVTSERIISEDCATQMAEGALRASGADLVVAITGVGGPDPEEGEPPGTVIICVGSRKGLRVFNHEFQGSPEEVVELATLHALKHLLGAALDLHGGA